MAGVSCLIVVLNDNVDVSVTLMPQCPMMAVLGFEQLDGLAWQVEDGRSEREW